MGKGAEVIVAATGTGLASSERLGDPFAPIERGRIAAADILGPGDGARGAAPGRVPAGRITCRRNNDGTSEIGPAMRAHARASRAGGGVGIDSGPAQLRA